MIFLCLVSGSLFYILEYLSFFVLVIGSYVGAHFKCRMYQKTIHFFF